MKVKKSTRSKVSTACVNCRKRKIKCTGKHPCTNCISYDCTCVFLKKHLPQKENSSRLLPSTAVPPPSSHPNVEASADVQHLDTAIKLDNQYYFKLMNDLIQTPVSPNTTHPSDASNDPNNDNNILFKDDSKYQNQLLAYQNILTNLYALPPCDDTQLLINNIKSQLNNLIHNWNPGINYPKLSNFSPHPQRSIETYLLTNKYRNKIHMTRFSFWTDQMVKSQGSDSFLATTPLVDEVFGLFSPIQAFSLRGIGYLIKKNLENTGSLMLIDTKETIYLILRLFDLCYEHLIQGCISISNPLENYLQKNKQTRSTTAPASLPTSPAPLSNDLVISVIHQLPQPFIQSITGFTTAQLIENLYDSFSMFRIVTQMYAQHRKRFAELLNHAFSLPHQKKCALFSSFCSSEYLLSTLCYAYYNVTLYHMLDINTLDYLEILVSLLEIQNEIDERFGFEKMLEVAVTCSTKMGLSRWEYYVGIDENTAERRRKIWWKIYSLEKRFLTDLGDLSLINEHQINCLLPKDFRDMGFINHKEFLTKIGTSSLSPSSPELKNLSLSKLIEYGELAIAQIVGDFFSETLYNEKFTSLETSVKPTVIRQKLLENVFEDIESFRLRLAKIKFHTSRVFQIAHSRYPEYSKNDLFEAAKFVSYHKNTWFSVLGAVNNLIARLSEDPEAITEQSSKYADEMCQEWREINQFLMQVDTDFIVWACLDFYELIFFVVASKFYVGDPHITLEDVINTLKVFKRITNIISFFNNNLDEKDYDCQTFREFSRSSSLVAISIRIMFLKYCYAEQIDRAEFIQRLKEVEPSLSDLLREFFDTRSFIYKYMLKSVEKSGFHLTIRKMLESDYKFLYRDKLATGNIPDQGNSNQILQLYDAAVPAYSNSSTSPANSPLKLSSLLNSGEESYTQDASENVPRQDRSSQQIKRQQAAPSQISGNENNIYNLGTLEEFVSSGDLTDLYHTLWSDNISNPFL
ncbi:drug-responsive transcription factor PDR3 [Saccharomyces paradoxus]|uniref:Drug-responsive transcription factor PDR3 n=1 Tax=Saccharomyces paradoxus TaxID=27291 RepID=A0A8B8ULF9_SACPA|nr:Pdr3 [Saccharomyces paradoxus]QHS71561.1 Pdr3 [Saccharomyces paradoxus]